MNHFSRATLIAAVLLASATAVRAELPNSINYQGRLVSALGVPLADNSYPATFKLYDAPTGGTLLWTENQMIAVRGGIFSAALGKTESNSFSATLFSQRLWLETTVDGKTLVPRQELAASPFAMMAQTVPDNSIGTAKLQPLSVTSPKIADGSISSAKLAQDGASLSRVSNGYLAYDPLGLQVTINRYLGVSIADRFNYGGYEIGNYSLGWYHGGGGAIARLSGYSGIQLFTAGAMRFMIDSGGSALFNGGVTTQGIRARSNVYIDSRGFSGDPTVDLAIGDSDTGFNWFSDGRFHVVLNGQTKTEFHGDRTYSYVKIQAPQFETYSSVRYKKNVTTIPNGLQLVLALRGVNYQWKSDGHADTGLIAEEVAKVIPQIVGFDGAGHATGLDYGKVVGVLVEAVKEQERRRVAEKASWDMRLQKLEARLARLEKESTK